MKTVSPRRLYLFLAAAFFALAFLELSIRDGDDRLAVLAGAVPAALVLGSLIPVRLFSLDRLMTSIALTLAAFGILAVAFLRPDDAVSGALQSAAAVAFLIPGALIVNGLRPVTVVAVILGVPALCLLSVPLIMPYLTFSCEEVSMLFLIIACVILTVRQKQLSAMLFALAGAALLLLNRHPLSAMIWCLCCFLLMWAYPVRLPVMLLSLSSVGLLFYGAYWLGFLELQAPGAPVLPFPPSLFGPESADFALAAGPDAFLPALAGRYGLIMAGSIMLLYPLMMVRGTALARASRSRFQGMLAMGITLLISLMALGALLHDMDVLPFQEIPMPFLSDSFPSLCSCFFMAGMLGGISARNRQALDEDARLSAIAR